MATGRSIVLFCLLSFLISSCSIVAPDPERAAVSHIEQKKWSAAESDLRKAFRKDTLNVEAKFIYAQYFLSSGNPAFNVDSAQRYTQNALVAWNQSTLKQKERLQKLGIDSIALLLFRGRVDSTAFERARQQNTVEAYSSFITHYPLASEHSEAVELRDEVAYLDALRKNTPAAFKSYVDTYPNSQRLKDAQDRYEQLIYKEKTASGNIDGYRSFLVQFPESAYKHEAEKIIFELSTSSGLPGDYRNFISQYPNSSQSEKAKDIVHYLSKNDSLQGYWIPFFKNGLYGFMNDDGVEVMSPQFEWIDSTYLCDNVKDDFVVTSSGIFSKNGALLLKKPVAKATDLGKGFLNIVDGDCHTIVHQSGFQVGDDCVEDARIVADQFIGLKKQKRWSVYAFNNKLLLGSTYDDISNVDKVIVLKRYGKNIVVRASQVAAVSPAKPLDESLVFDDVRAWGEGNLWVKNGILEGVIGQDLKFIIPLDRQILIKTSFGFIRKKDTKLQVVGISPALEALSYDDVRDYGDWLDLKTANRSTLYRVSQNKVVAGNLDSVWIKNRVAFGAKNDSLNVYAGAGRLASFERSEPVTFIKSSDSIVYFWAPERKNKVVYEASQGKRLFSLDFDDIQAIRKDLFVFTRKNKKGIWRDGKIILQPEYEAIVQSPKGYLALLKDGKFGLYDIENQKLIKSHYNRGIVPYSDDYFVAYKDGYGIITGSEEPVTGFDFEEIRYWNDTSAWVKKNFSWSILSIKDKSFRLSKIRSFQNIKDHDGEKIVRVQQDNYFGIVSNRKGVVISPTFTEIINVGSEDKPFYFTEKRVEEAGIYVVIYYNSEGKLVRKQVYEEEEYEKIYCDN